MEFLTRPISPSDIRGFPFLNKTMPDCIDECNPFADYLDELINDSVVPEPFLVRSVGIGDDYQLCQLTRGDDGAMCDGGANVCMGRDRTKLRRVHKIKPIAIGMAMKSEEPTSVMMIDEMGYYPIPMLDGTECEVPCLLDERATDFIFSPDAIVLTNSSFASWVQVGHRGDIPGQFRILDHGGNAVVELPLHKWNGLYYFTLDDLQNLPGTHHAETLDN